MNDILLADSDTDTLGKIFVEIKRILPCWVLQTVSEKYKEEILSII